MAPTKELENASRQCTARDGRETAQSNPRQVEASRPGALCKTRERLPKFGLRRGGLLKASAGVVRTTISLRVPGADPATRQTSVVDGPRDVPALRYTVSRLAYVYNKTQGGGKQQQAVMAALGRSLSGIDLVTS
ncbi:hypothetical protein CSOJ01_10178 [Colletotrichum sojae]|uniref:Uncharacterized protein n=1 Tax=Colletotrichum sojae TaxID=2175907 RepID=A0A8H6MQG5_9PEZI|nr:hypothetical protein CSOJ01_10178 [Colletotrichum sojae]